MYSLNSDFVDKVVQNCFDLYNKLPKTGKPVEKEWTVISCFLKYDRSTNDVEVVSLGTGSKCIGASKMSSSGDVLNDSHAEVIARRAFLLYLYENIYKANKGETSIFVKELEQWKLNDNLEFIFYTSQLPCGDASIIPKNGEEEFYGDILTQLKHKADDDLNESEIKRRKLNDIHRTGAKCLTHCEQDSREPGSNYHLLGQVRTKPGRGDRTLSVSCSDKIAKWIHLGVQGSLIDIFCGSIFIKYFIFGAGVPYSQESLNRALLNRNMEVTIQLGVVPEFYQTSLVFPNIRDIEHIRAAPGSIVWVKSGNQLLEVAVLGKKLGVTKKRANLPSSSLCISKYNIYRTFLNIVKSDPDLKRVLCDQENVDSIPYNLMKSKSTRYRDRWRALKCNFFKTWTVKPDMWDFCVNL
ncbi:unnamed protein product [Arctia plantaginis]|uniref:tRNA-specific adenosine deaminase 1 n=1 Tax=Arctia plantaginis TaxID=874455 RepID=A0A8S1A3I1_ARCPL|nr:unnamed protein product [Arctia plantaginis]